VRNNRRFIDLTHPLHPGIPTWEGSCGFQLVGNGAGSRDPAAPSFKLQSIRMETGVGTHLDSPSHLFSSGMTVELYPLEQLVAPCRVLDVSSRAAEEFVLQPDDLKDYESESGVLEAGCVVLIRTGWDRFWDRPDQYRNGLVFPSVSGAAAEGLLERGVIGLGIDTLSPDRGDSGYPVHHLFLGAGNYLLENVANLAQMPTKGAELWALPLAIQGGSEAPVRLVALAP